MTMFVILHLLSLLDRQRKTSWFWVIHFLNHESWKLIELNSLCKFAKHLPHSLLCTGGDRPSMQRPSGQSQPQKGPPTTVRGPTKVDFDPILFCVRKNWRLTHLISNRITVISKPQTCKGVQLFHRRMMTKSDSSWASIPQVSSKFSLILT